MAVDENHYAFAGQPNLIFGRRFEPQYTREPNEPWNSDKDAAQRHFQPLPGVYRARDLVAMFGPLLDTCIRRVGRDRASQEQTRNILLDGLAAILATAGRESSLPLRNGGGGGSDVGRSEMTRQADAIGTALLRYARESLDPERADPSLRISSHCDGHLWTHDVVGSLMGPRGDSVVMQLYNEWSHRVVLLRNTLLPFENWDETPLVIPSDASSGGMRVLEGPSDAFVMRLLSGRLPQKSIVDLAKALTAPSLPSGGFGFQYAQGTVLPAFLSGSQSRSLLRYYPARESGTPSEVLFEYEHPSYEAAERSELALPPSESTRDSTPSSTVKSLLQSRPITGTKDTKAHLLVGIELRGHPEALFPVCLGQIARGRRYAARVGKGSASHAPAAVSAVMHQVEAAIVLPGLVFSAAEPETNDQTLHVFLISDPLLGLALFGKLYPGNVVVLGKEDDLARATQGGRGFGTKFVHWPRV